MSTYLHNDKGYIRLVQCFLSPNLLVRCKENPTSTYQQESKNQREQFDYLYDLFDPTKQDGLGNLDIMHELSCEVQESGDCVILPSS